LKMTTYLCLFSGFLVPLESVIKVATTEKIMNLFIIFLCVNVVFILMLMEDSVFRKYFY